MNNQQFKDRVTEVLKEELQTPEIFWYLSFADKYFKGGVIIKAHGISDATMKCNLLQINPGGEVWCIEIPEGFLPDEKYHNKLLTKEEIQEFWPDAKSLKELEEEDNGSNTTKA